jgi:hypothetical protein
MGVLDFLFQGSPPPSTTTYGTSVQNIPQFMTDYTQGLLSKANAVAAEPYQAYGGPRLAQFSPEQTSAFDKTSASMGMYQPTLNSAIDMTQQGGAYDVSGAASPYMAAASRTAPSVIGSYMNPYQDAVVNRIGQLAGRNLRENLMPNVNTNFIRAGQFGSAGQQAAIGNALRDTQESALAEQAKALQQGYGAATTAAQADLTRQAQLAQTAGNIAQNEAANRLTAGSQMGTLGQMGQSMNLKDIAALEAVGQTKQGQAQKSLDTAYQDFLAQRKYPQEQLSMLNALIRGLPYSSSGETASTGPANTYQPSPLAQIAGAAALGSGLKLYKEGGEVKRNPNRRSSRGKKRK